MPYDLTFIRKLWLMSIMCSVAIYTHSIALDNDAEMQLLDTIKLTLKENRVDSYTCEFVVAHEGKMYGNDGDSKPLLTKAKYKYEKPSIKYPAGRFLHEIENGFSYSIDQKKMLQFPKTTGNNGKKFVRLKNVTESQLSSGMCPDANIDVPDKAYHSDFFPQQFLSTVTMSGQPLLDFLIMNEERVKSVQEVDQYVCEIVCSQEGDNADYEVTFTVDARYGWNVTSEAVRSSDGRLLHAKTVEFDFLNGIPFIKSGRYEKYTNSEIAEPVEVIELTVYMDSVTLNPVFSDADFFVELPVGTRVRDNIFGITYTVGADDRYMFSPEAVLV